MFSKIRICMALILSLCIVNGLQAEPILVDDFSAAQTGAGVVDDANILGGERDVVANGLNTTFTAAGGAAVMGVSSGDTNFVILDYDGDDNSASEISFFLGALDFTDGGSNDAIFLEVLAVTGSIDAQIRMNKSLVDFIVVDFPIDAVGIVEVPFAPFSSHANVTPESVDRLSVRFIFDAGESLTLNSIFINRDELFDDGFEAP